MRCFGKIGDFFWWIVSSGYHQRVVYLSLILYNFNLKPSNSVRTAENADKTTTLVILYRYGLAQKPEILYGLSSSLSRSAASLRTWLARVSSSFLCGFCSICKYRLICSVINMERFSLYLRLILVPSIISRIMKSPSARFQKTISQQ